MPSDVHATARDRARRFVEADRIDEARAAYLAILTQAPDDVGALADFGTLLLRTGYRDAARTLFLRARVLAPHDARAHLNLANVDFADGAFEDARAGYAHALACEPQFALAHAGLAYALTRLGRPDEATPHRVAGFAGRALERGTYRGAGVAREVLLIVSARGGTVNTDALIDDRLVRTTTLVADVYAGDPPLGEFAVAFNALGDADLVGEELRAIDARFAGRPQHILNHPKHVLATTRVENAARLGRLPGVVTPQTLAFSRAELLADPQIVARAFSYPLLVRAPGFQTGEHFTFVGHASELPAALAALPGDDVLVLAYLDVRSDDGFVRKYRMMIVAGELYPMHCAIATDWKVHFFRADLREEHRAEDARFLNDPQAAIGAPAIAALERVRDVLGLDYAGIDFALDRDGRVAIFEANATMIVVPPGPDPKWDYRRAPVARVIDAFRAMIAPASRAER